MDKENVYAYCGTSFGPKKDECQSRDSVSAPADDGVKQR